MASKSVTLEAPAHEAAKYKAAIGECVAEIDLILKRMRRKQARIDRMGARTRARLAELKALK